MDLTGLTEKRNQRGSRYFIDSDGDCVAKECRDCASVKWINEFYNMKHGFGGKSTYCKECARKRRREYHHSDKSKKYREKEKKRLQIYFAKHPEKRRESVKRSYHKNKKTFHLRTIRRRARMQGLSDNLTVGNTKKIVQDFGNRCALTGTTEIHMDHVIPSSIGHGGTIFGNLVPLQDVLNVSKSDRNIFEWFADNRDRFGLPQQRFDELIKYLADINGLTPQEYEDFVYWCHDNPRTVEEIEADNEKYGYKKPSIEIWHEQLTKGKRDLIEV